MNTTIKSTDKYAEFVSILQHKGSLSHSDLNKLKRIQVSAMSDSIPELLIKLGLCSEKAIAESFIQCKGLNQAEDYPLESPLDEAVSFRFLKHHHVVALNADETHLSLSHQRVI